MDTTTKSTTGKEDDTKNISREEVEVSNTPSNMSEEQNNEVEPDNENDQTVNGDNNMESNTEETTGTDQEKDTDAQEEGTESSDTNHEETQEGVKEFNTDDSPSSNGSNVQDLKKISDLSEINTVPSTFEFRIDLSQLQKFFSDINTMAEECRLHSTPYGMKVRAPDPSNVGMVDENLGSESFETYTASRGVIGVDVEKVNNVLSNLESGKLVHWEFNTQTHQVKIEQDGLDFNISTIDPSSVSQEPDIPDLNLPNELVIDSSEFDRAIKAADMVSDHVDFESVENPQETFAVIGAEGDTDEVEVCIEEDDWITASLSGNKESKYSLSYLKGIRKAIPSTSPVTIKWGDDYPIKFQVSDDEDQRKAEFLVAPRIQSD